MSVGSPIGFFSNYLDTRQTLPLEFDREVKPLTNHKLLLKGAQEIAKEDQFLLAFIENKLNDPEFRTNPRPHLTKWRDQCWDLNFSLAEEVLALKFFEDNINLL